MKKMLLLAMIALLVLGSSACGKPTPTSEAAPTLQGKSILMIIAHRDFRDEEYKEPRQIFEARGGTVSVASSSLEVAKGALGAQVKPDLLLKDVAVDGYDAIVFVGGPGAQEYWDDPVAHAVAQEAVAQGKVLAAICIAPATLAKAGVLQGKRATVFSSEAGELKARGANYTGASVERDGLIITANGPKAAVEFAEEIAKALEEWD
ncbi:MAG: DJ-1/PfpI family protein [Anaerolineae bacterium]